MDWPDRAAPCLNIVLLGASRSALDALKAALMIALRDALTYALTDAPSNASSDGPQLPWRRDAFSVVVCQDPTLLADRHHTSPDLVFLLASRVADERALAVESATRAELSARHWAYHVLCGDLATVLPQAVGLIGLFHSGLSPSMAPEQAPEAIDASKKASGGQTSGSWVWACDKCSDPGCEQALLTRLISQRTAH